MPTGTPGLGGALIPMTLFAAAQASDLFLLMRAGEGWDAPATLPLLWMALHVVKATSAFAGGRLVDRFGPRAVIATGWALFAGTFAGLAAAESSAVVLALVLCAGAHHGLRESGERALVASLAAPPVRGTAFGRYHLATGLGSIAANAVFGWIWDAHQPSTAFACSAAIAAVALVAWGGWLAFERSGTPPPTPGVS
jgi:MFS family permease